MQFRHHHRDALFDLLRWRRDVRHFRPDGVDPRQIAKLEQAMNLAPSVGNSRPWRVILVERVDARRRILADHDAANAAAAERYAPAERPAYRSLKLAGLLDAPVHLAVFTDLDPPAGRGLGRQTMPETLVYSTVIAIHTLWLAARAMNLGVGWVSIVNPDVVCGCLEAASSWHFTAYLCVGHPAFDDDQPELARRGWELGASAAWQIR